MLTAGIVCEYNPFHLGHARLIRYLREKGATHIVAVMSGNFVQRGEASVLSKQARARQALSCGVDLIVELPLPWAVAGAERFALGGVSLLDAVGADWIGFGSECGNLELLSGASAALSSPSLRDFMREELSRGATFAAARQSAVARLFNTETAKLLREPNNILGIEYLRAISRIHSSMVPCTMLRSGATHDALIKEETLVSSRQIRSLLQERKNCSAFLPPPSFAVLREEMEAERAPASLSFLERGILAKLRETTKEELAALPDISEGLENRIYSAVRQATGLNELYLLIKTKRYPLARIRRLVLSAFLGLKAVYAAEVPPYLRILGIGERGGDILRADRIRLPVISRASDLNGLDARSKEIAALESKASDLYALCLPKALPCGRDWTSPIALF